jgi:hypothetical protein
MLPQLAAGLGLHGRLHDALILQPSSKKISCLLSKTPLNSLPTRTAYVSLSCPTEYVVRPHAVGLFTYKRVPFLQKKTIAQGSSPPTGYIVSDSLWPGFMQRLEESHMIIEFTFRSQGSHNQSDLSNEVVEHLAEHNIRVPAHEDDEQDIRFILCAYKRARAPASRRAGYEHRVTRDENASVDDWSLVSLRRRNPDVQYRGSPVIFIGGSCFYVLFDSLPTFSFATLMQPRGTTTSRDQSPNLSMLWTYLLLLPTTLLMLALQTDYVQSSFTMHLTLNAFPNNAPRYSSISHYIPSAYLYLLRPHRQRLRAVRFTMESVCR